MAPSVGSVFCVFEISRIGGAESHPTLLVVRVPPGLQSRVSHRRMANKAKGLLWFGRKVSFAKGTEPNDLLNDSNGLTIGTVPRATVALDNFPTALPTCIVRKFHVPALHNPSAQMSGVISPCGHWVAGLFMNSQRDPDAPPAKLHGVKKDFRLPRSMVWYDAGLVFTLREICSLTWSFLANTPPLDSRKGILLHSLYQSTILEWPLSKTRQNRTVFSKPRACF